MGAVRAIAAGSALLLVIALSACVPPDLISAPAPTGTGGGALDGDTPGSEPSAVESTAESCPQGRWVLDNDSWAASLTAMMATELPGAAVRVDGELLLDWNADGTYLLTAHDSRYIVSGITEGDEFAMTIHHDGTESGSWTGSGASYELAATDESGWSSVVQMEAGGQQLSVDQSALPTDPWSGAMTVGCRPGILTTTVVDSLGALTVTFLART